MVHLQMRLPSLEQLPPIPELPSGYVLREYKESDLNGLASVLDRAFDDVEWSPETVRERLIDAPDVKKTYVILHGDTLVATASARILPEEFPDSGYLHWVGVDPDYRGKELGRAVTLAVLHEFVRLGCKNAVLETQDHRLAAIKVYKKLGFEEHHVHESHLLRWAAIADMLASVNL